MKFARLPLLQTANSAIERTWNASGSKELISPSRVVGALTHVSGAKVKFLPSSHIDRLSGDIASVFTATMPFNAACVGKEMNARTRERDNNILVCITQVSKTSG